MQFAIKAVSIGSDTLDCVFGQWWVQYLVTKFWSSACTKNVTLFSTGFIWKSVTLLFVRAPNERSTGTFTADFSERENIFWKSTGTLGSPSFSWFSKNYFLFGKVRRERYRRFLTLVINKWTLLTYGTSKVKWGASSRWSFGPIFAWCSKESSTIGKTHPSL